MKWRLKDFKNLLLEILFFLIGGLLIFPIIFMLGFIYSFLKHLFIKTDYSISRQLIPVIRSITLAIDGVANAGAGELLNDLFDVPKTYKIRYGNWNQTISAVTGLLKAIANKDTWLRKFLEILGKNHCEKAITEQDNFYYKNNL